MKQALHIMLYGITTVLGNLGTAFRLAGLLWLVSGAVLILLENIMLGDQGEDSVFYWTFRMLDIAINLLVFSYCILVWLRYCMGKDVPNGWLPSVKDMPFPEMTLIVAVIGILYWGYTYAAIGTMLSAYLILPDTPPRALAFYMPFVALTTFFILMMFLPAYIILRFGPTISATAIGEKITLRDSLLHSHRKGLTLAALFVTALFEITLHHIVTPVFSFIIGPDREGPYTIAMWVEAFSVMATSWIFLMIFVSYIAATHKKISQRS